jgi:hypothetical protein
LKKISAYADLYIRNNFTKGGIFMAIKQLQIKKTVIIGDIVSSSYDIINISTTADLAIGDIVYGTGIPANTKILGIDENTITLNNAATSTLTQVAITVNTENVVTKYAQQLYNSISINDLEFNGTQNININAADIPYDNTVSELVSTNLQDAINELVDSIDSLEIGELNGYESWTLRLVNNTYTQIGNTLSVANNTTINLREGNNISLDIEGNIITVNQKTINRDDLDVVELDLLPSGSFTVVTNVLSDTSGHVTGLATTEFTLPELDNYQSWSLGINDEEDGLEVLSGEDVRLSGFNNVSITRDNNTNNLIFESTDTLQSVTSREDGNTTSSAIRITNETDSANIGAGSLIVSGGVGIQKNLNIGQTLKASNLIITNDAGTPLNDITLQGKYISGIEGDRHAAIRGPEVLYIDPATHGTNAGTVVVMGNLDVRGTTTTLNAQDLTIENLDIVVANGIDILDSSDANGAGILVGNINPTLAIAGFTYNDSVRSWLSSINLEIAKGNDLILNGSESGFTVLKASDETEDNIITLPAISGTVALISDLPHSMTSDTHIAGNWKIFYSNGAGNVVELPLGIAGKILKSNGLDSAPTWENDIDTNNFIDLLDTPSTYEDKSNFLVKVNASSTGLEFTNELNCGTY